jgi:hypothetical protein
VLAVAIAQAVSCRLHADIRNNKMSNLHSVAVTCVPRRLSSSLAALHHDVGLKSMLGGMLCINEQIAVVPQAGHEIILQCKVLCALHQPGCTIVQLSLLWFHLSSPHMAASQLHLNPKIGLRRRRERPGCPAGAGTPLSRQAAAARRQGHPVPARGVLTLRKAQHHHHIGSSS